jgi:hypothetical protein
MMTSSNSVLSSAIDPLNPIILGAIAARSMLFVDGGVGDYQQIVASAEAGTEVHLLDGGRDAIGQITDVLGGRSGISALHILSHGANGELGFASGAIRVWQSVELYESVEVLEQCFDGGGGYFALWL